MATHQSSVKGKGEEVLRGAPQTLPAQTEETPPEQTPETVTEPEAAASAAAELPASSPAIAEGELGSALYEEARAAESPPAAADAPWLEEAAWPPSAEAEPAVSGQDQLSQAISQATMAASDGAMTTGGFGEVAQDDWDMQAPEEKVEPVELPEVPLPAGEEEALTEAAGDRFTKLNAEIDAVYEQVLNEVGDNEAIATECYNSLLKARDIVLRQDVSRLAQAEYYVGLARARLKRASDSAVGAKKNAWWIFAWGLLWGMSYAASVVLLDSAYVQDKIALLNLRNSVIDPRVLLPAMVWGGIGGVLAIWYSLFKHVAARDFDGHYNISYLGKPFFGLVLGATVYMIVSLMVTSLGIWPSGMTSSATGVAVPMVTPWIIYFVAMVAGFKENRVFGLIDQIMKWIFPEKGTTTTLDGDLS
jgi:hypothetical protein